MNSSCETLCSSVCDYEFSKEIFFPYSLPLFVSIKFPCSALTLRAQSFRTPALCGEESFGASQVKNLPASVGAAGATGSVFALGRSPGEGHGTTLQYSCLQNPLDREAWQAAVHGVTKDQT